MNRPQGDDMRKRPDYGNATPEDLARALFRPVSREAKERPKPQGQFDTVRKPIKDRSS